MIEAKENTDTGNRASELQRELKRWIEILRNRYHPDKIVLFGSLANGTIHRWSDVDLVIIKDTDKAFLDRSKEVLSLIQPKVGVDILVYTHDEFRDLCASRLFFRTEIESRGVTVYERGG